MGLKSSADAGRLAEELAFADQRLRTLEQDPPGLYREVADAGADIEERSWLAFLIAYLCPLEDEDPFAEIERVRTSWASGELPVLDERAVRAPDRPRPGPRDEDARGVRAWAARAGSQASAYTGDAAWPPERRFARAFERLSLPGLHRDARFDLLVTLGRLGVYDMRGGDAGVRRRERRHGWRQARVRDRRLAAARAPGCGPRASVRHPARGARSRSAQLAARRAGDARSRRRSRGRAGRALGNLRGARAMRTVSAPRSNHKTALGFTNRGRSGRGYLRCAAYSFRRRSFSSSPRCASWRCLSPARRPAAPPRIECPQTRSGDRSPGCCPTPSSARPRSPDIAACSPTPVTWQAAAARRRAARRRAARRPAARPRARPAR